MGDPVSISIKQISPIAKRSAAGALAKHKAAFPAPIHTIGFVPPYWFGLIIHNPPHHVVFADANNIAIEVQNGIVDSIPSLRGGKAGVILGDGNLTIGFAPPELTVIEE